MKSLERLDVACAARPGQTSDAKPRHINPPDTDKMEKFRAGKFDEQNNLIQELRSRVEVIQRVVPLD